jgi:hypothetical protein
MCANINAFDNIGNNGPGYMGNEYNDNNNEYTYGDDNEYDDDDESDIDDDESDLDGDVIYDPEEKSPTRYNIVLCELHNPKMHGIDPQSNVGCHYLVDCRFKRLNMKIINLNASIIKHVYSRLLNRNDARTNNHPIYKNYTNIVAQNTYIKPEIAECIYLESQECVAILKTCWIRLIQRTWKNIMRKRAVVIQKRTHPNALYSRQITGNWPSDCLIYPGLRGMLSLIKN